MQSDSLRTEFLEHRKLDADDIKRNKELFATFKMSVSASDKISVNRSIPNFCHPNCLHENYFQNLSKISIVIIVHNKIFSVFKRMLHSLYHRAPNDLVAEKLLSMTPVLLRTIKISNPSSENIFLTLCKLNKQQLS